MGLDPEKYRVYKDAELGGPITEANQIPLKSDSYFVLRKGDILAIPTLRSYQGHIRALLDVDEFNKSTHRTALFTDEDRKHFEELHEDIGKMLTQWEYDERKIPD